MKKNKNKKILIISIAVVAVILIAGIVFAFAGGLFKSDKDKFFEYALQLFDNDNGFIDDKIRQYYQKRNSSVFENEGKFTANINSENLEDETLDNISNLSITFAGNTDSVNNQAEQLIKINYSDSVNFPIWYKKTDGLAGIKLSEISKRYFVLEEDKIGEFVNQITGSEAIEDMSAKAINAKLSNALVKEMDNISSNLVEITTDYYDKKYKQNKDVSLPDMIFEYKFKESEDCTLEINREEKDKTIGTITIVLTEDPTYAAIGTISDTGAIEWDKKFGTYQADETGETDKTVEENSKKFNLDFSFTNEERNRIKDKVIEATKSSINTASFTKISTSNSEGYSLELTNEQLREILIKLLEALKDDEQLLKKFNLKVANVQPLINQLSTTKVNEGKSNITVYQSNKKLNKIEILFNDAIRITISKRADDDNVEYNITLESQSYSINLNLMYTGLKNLEQVQETYQLTITMGESGTEYSYLFENSINFAPEEFEIKEFQDGEYMNLSEFDNEKIAKVFELIGKGIQETNKEKMDKLGIKGENPLLSIIPGISILNSANNVLVNNNSSIITNNANTNSTNTTNSNTTSTNTTTSSGSVVSGIEQAEKEAFNAKFNQYEGNTIRGSTVKSLMMVIIANNMADEERKIEVTGDIKLTGDEVPDSIESSKTYKVKCYTGDEGYINKIEVLVNN